VGERYLDTVEVTGSIPVSPTRYIPWSDSLSVINTGGLFCVRGRNWGKDHDLSASRGALDGDPVRHVIEAFG
jgi:hypothetical protein